uniref:pre-toxin TG domain-containing protein n=1 Tax=Paenibacillus daejeonensis TaxID=135193 RepID=UPI001FDF20D5
EDSFEGFMNRPSSLNAYTYVENNPLRFTDPMGMCVHLDNFTDFWDCTLDLAPGIGNVKGGAQAIFGENLVTGEELSTSERIWEGVSVLPFGSWIKKGRNLLGFGNKSKRTGDASKGNYNDHDKVKQGDNSTYKILSEETDWMKDQGMASRGTINGRKTWYDGENYYQWDSQHGRLEKWDKKQKNHLGEFDPVTGEQTGNPIKKRRWGG